MFSLDSEEKFPLTLASWFFLICTFEVFNCRNYVSQKIPKVRLLSSFTSQNTFATFFRFISLVFSLCIEKGIQWFNHSCDIVLLSQFLMRCLEEADCSLTTFAAGGTRYNFKKKLFLRRDLFVNQCCFWYNLLLQKLFFHYCLQILFSKSGVVLTIYNDLFLHRNQK